MPLPASNRALLAAARNGSIHELQDALLGGADPHCIDSCGLTPLMLSVAHGSLPHLSLLLPLSNPLSKSHAGDTALMIAIRLHRPELADTLIPASDLFARDAMGASILVLCAIHGLVQTAKQTLLFATELDPGAARILALPDAQGMGPLMWASKRLDLPMAELLSFVDDPGRSDSRGRTALIHAFSSAHHGSSELVASLARLLAPLAPVLARDADGFSAADLARQARLPQIADWIETVGHAQHEASVLLLDAQAGAHSQSTVRRPRL